MISFLYGPRQLYAGKRFGMLLAMSQDLPGKKATVKFMCDCGNLCSKKIKSVQSALNVGQNPSCGCATVKHVKQFDFTRYFNKKFGRLLITGFDRDDGKIKLVCLCDCGAQTRALVQDIVSLHTTSCGCLHQELRSKLGKEQIKHGHTTFGALNGHTPIYRSWLKITAGCLEGHRKGVHLVCHEFDKRWESFDEFYKDFGDIKKSQTISRIDNQNTWCKENCYINIGRRTS